MSTEIVFSCSFFALPPSFICSYSSCHTQEVLQGTSRRLSQMCEVWQKVEHHMLFCHCFLPTILLLPLLLCNLSHLIALSLFSCVGLPLAHPAQPSAGQRRKKKRKTMMIKMQRDCHCVTSSTCKQARSTCTVHCCCWSLARSPVVGPSAGEETSAAGGAP